MKPAKLLPALTSILLAPAIVFGATAKEVVQRAEVADRYVSYRGMKVASVYFGSALAKATLKVVHLKPDKTRTEYFAPPALAGIILIQNGLDRWKYHPREKVWHELLPCSALPNDVIRRGAFENYHVRLLGTDRVAGRQTYVIQAVPKRKGESARRVWVDKQFYLVVRTQDESLGGWVINSSRYTTIDFNPSDISASTFKVTGKIKSAPKPAGIKFPIVKPSYLPPGYKLVGVAGMKVSNHSCAHLQFSNGANTISLFERIADKKTAAASIQSKITNVLMWTRKGMLFTLMGDVSRAELQKIADSIK